MDGVNLKEEVCRCDVLSASRQKIDFLPSYFAHLPTSCRLPFVGTKPSIFPPLGAEPPGASTVAERLTPGADSKMGIMLEMALFIHFFEDSCLTCKRTIY